MNNKASGEISKIPAEDLGFLVLDNYQITISTNAINKIGSNGGAVITSGSNHHPLMLALPLDGNYLQTERLRKQINASAPQIKNLWQQVVRAKIRNQAMLLKHFGKEEKNLTAKIERVRSGDSTKQEGIAAQYYWKTLFSGTDFRRDPDGDFPNNFLNYGYAIIRAVTARAIVTAGLHPSFGIFHKNKFNAFCLADDLMEPYRPVVDNIVYEYYLENPYQEFLHKEGKKMLINAAFQDVKIGTKTHPVSVAIQMTCASLNDYFTGKVKKIKLPELCL
ncbi:MAG: CRISPR-associated protein Cas1 [Ignavibacteria bacterium]|nr:CRISPR-associated protein Cas1 [Ignavibacteria bacterium]